MKRKREREREIDRERERERLSKIFLIHKLNDKFRYVTQNLFYYFVCFLLQINCPLLWNSITFISSAGLLKLLQTSPFVDVMDYGQWVRELQV